MDASDSPQPSSGLSPFESLHRLGIEVVFQDGDDVLEIVAAAPPLTVHGSKQEARAGSQDERDTYCGDPGIGFISESSEREMCLAAKYEGMARSAEERGELDEADRMWHEQRMHWAQAREVSAEVTEAAERAVNRHAGGPANVQSRALELRNLAREARADAELILNTVGSEPTRGSGTPAARVRPRGRRASRGMSSRVRGSRRGAAQRSGSRGDPDEGESEPPGGRPKNLAGAISLVAPWRNERFGSVNTKLRNLLERVGEWS